MAVSCSTRQKWHYAMGHLISGNRNCKCIAILCSIVQLLTKVLSAKSFSIFKYVKTFRGESLMTLITDSSLDQDRCVLEFLDTCCYIARRVRRYFLTWHQPQPESRRLQIKKFLFGSEPANKEVRDSITQHWHQSMIVARLLPLH